MREKKVYACGIKIYQNAKKRKEKDKYVLQKYINTWYKNKRGLKIYKHVL